MSRPWTTGRMLAFDTETTGVDVERDRIVSFCVALIPSEEERAVPGNHVDPIVRVVNPGIDIPEGATAVHGITNEVAQTHGMDPGAALEFIVLELEEARDDGVPVVAFNAAYDLTLLDRELERHGVRTPNEGWPYVIDPYVIDKAVDKYRKGKRTLAAVCEHYGMPIRGDAHTADADAMAAARLAWRMGVLRDSVEMWGNLLPDTLHDLHARQAKWYMEQAESFRAYLHKQADAAGCAPGAETEEVKALRDRAGSIRTEWPIHAREPF